MSSSSTTGDTATPSVEPKNKARVHEHTHEHPNCAQQSCLYLGSGGKRCLQPITCATVPEHFESHGIKAIYRRVGVTCQWEGCFERCSRHNFVRHIREKHLGHTRRTARNSEKGRREHTSLHEEPGDAGSRDKHRVSEHAKPGFVLCEFPNSNGTSGSCGEVISHATISTHFAYVHGVRDMCRQAVIACDWGGCKRHVRRHSFLRHIREAHLGHTRKKAG